MKKGFTLVELLAVIVLVGAIAAISFPLVTNQLNNSKQKSYETQIKTIERAANNWGAQNVGLLPDVDGQTKNISIDRLQKDGFITKGDIVDPRTEENLTGCVEITYDDEYKQPSYKYKSSCATIDIQ